MKSVILGGQLGPVLRALDSRPGPVVYIHLTATRESFQVLEYLRQRPNAQELPASELFRERRESFRKKYIQFIGRLNESNACLEWWGMPLTDRLPNRPDLYRDVGHFLLIVELIRLRTETLVVISDSPDLSAQVLTWASQEEVEVVNLIKMRWSLRNILKLYTPAGIIIAFLKMVFLRWPFARRYWPPPNTQDGHVVITSFTHLRSFAVPGQYQDAYFGPLVESMAESGQRALILAGIQERPTAQLKMLKTVHPPLPIVLVESCLSFWDLLSSLFRALSWYFKSARAKNSANVDGIDVSCLVNRAVRQERHSGSLFNNLGMYYAARRLARTVPVTRWVYPFENLAWEKMLLLGAYSISRELEMVGYQHACLTKSHTELLLPNQNEPVMPLPETILTTGDITKNWLETEANYPPETIVKTACALRQTPFPTREAKPREPRLSKLLVALATSQEEYVRSLVFLERGFYGIPGYEVKIRPHPLIPLEPALKTAPVSHPDFCLGSDSPLRDDLQWADVVLYSSSTVGLEAIQLGIPSIHLDLGNVLDTDPMFDWDEFKWSVEEPSQLIETLRKIEGLSDPEYLARQEKGREYAASYLQPVTENALQVFSAA